MSIDSSSGPDWPRDAQELFVAFWEAATFHAGALQAARDYADKFDASAADATGPINGVADEFAVDAEIFKEMAEDLIETFARLSRRVRVTVEKSRLDQLENPREVRHLRERIQNLHRELYIECLESLGHGVDQAKEIANALRANPKQTARPEHLAQLDDVIDEAEEILNRNDTPERRFDAGEREDEDEDNLSA